MLIKMLTVGNIEENCYIVTDENTLESAVIDPGDESNVILDYIESNHLKVREIFLTHGHFDHTGAVETVAEETGANIWINRKDATDGYDMYRFRAPEGTKYYEGGDKIKVGGLTFRVFETPGHSEGSVTLRCDEALFTGDTLFRDSCGRTDLPGGDMNKLMDSLRKLSELPGDFEIYPGHERTTTLSREKSVNYFMRTAAGR